MTKKDPIHRPPPAPIASGDLKLMGFDPEQSADQESRAAQGTNAPRGRGRKPSGGPTRIPLGVRCLPSYQTRLEKLWNRWRSKDRTVQKGQVVEKALEMLFKEEGV